MSIVNENGLLIDSAPDDLSSYVNMPEYCRGYTREQYELLRTMLKGVRNLSVVSYLLNVIEENSTPERITEAIRKMPNAYPGLFHIKEEQALVQQVADKDLPLFVGISTKVLRTILEWRFKCQAK